MINRLKLIFMKLFKHSETYISEKVRLTGDIEADADISIDGEVRGNMISKKHVMLGMTSKFEGNIESDSALICGNFKGKIVAKRCLEVKTPATIVGDLISDSVRLDSGVAIQGRILAKSVEQVSRTPSQTQGAPSSVAKE